MDKSIVLKLLDNTSLALVVIGLFLFVIGAAGGWPNPPLQIVGSGWQVALAIIGSLVSGIGILSFWREKTRNKTAQTLSCDDCGIQIVSPQDGDRVEHSFLVAGVYKNLPEGTEIQVFTTYGEGKKKEYWPQASTTIRKQDKTWHSKVNWLGGETGETGEILVAVVGKDGQALIEYYNKAGYETDKWPGIAKLTSDVIECVSMKVTIK